MQVFTKDASTHSFPVLPYKNDKLDAHIDCGVATMWSTVKMLDDIRCIENKKYLVQGFETDFYDFTDPRKIEASQSYSFPFEIITVSGKNWGLCLIAFNACNKLLGESLFSS